MLAVSFGVLATLLAAIGLYGVLAYATAQRTREIGIRMALGAQRRAVMRLVLADVLWLAGISIVVTLPMAILLSRVLRSQLYNVSPADPLIMVSGVAASQWWSRLPRCCRHAARPQLNPCRRCERSREEQFAMSRADRINPPASYQGTIARLCRRR